MLCLQFQGHMYNRLGNDSEASGMLLQRSSKSSLLPNNSEYIFFPGKKMPCITSTPSLPAEWKEPCACWISTLSPTLGKMLHHFFQFMKHVCSKASSSCLRLSLPTFSLVKMRDLGKKLGAGGYLSLARIFFFASLCLLLYDKDCQVLVAAS